MVLMLAKGTETEGGVLSRSLDIIFNSIYEQRAEWFTFKPDKQNNIIVQVHSPLLCVN